MRAGVEAGKELVAAGAGVVEIEWAGPSDARALVAGAGVPVAICTDATHVALAAVQAGVRLVAGGATGAREVLAAAADGGIAVVVTAGPAAADALAARREAVVRRARAAEAAGVGAERIVVDPGLAASPDLLGHSRRFAELGYPVLLSADGIAAMALAVTGGCRLVRTEHVKPARRVCDVLGAILEARA